MHMRTALILKSSDSKNRSQFSRSKMYENMVELTVRRNTFGEPVSYLLLGAFYCITSMADVTSNFNTEIASNSPHRTFGGHGGTYQESTVRKPHRA